MKTNNNSILFVVGARPNFIKIAPLCTALKSFPHLPFKIVHTGQHYDESMSEVFFRELDIPAPDFHLNIGSGSHGRQTGQMMIHLEDLMLNHPCSVVVVIGDVNSTLAGALVGAKLNIPVVHIEAGLRSYNRHMPEEINRIATDHVSDLLFAPTGLAMETLKSEGLADRSVFSGDVMYDMILNSSELARRQSDILQRLKLQPKDYYLATLHRPYNVDDPEQLQEIIHALSEVDKTVLISAHPRLKKNLEQFNIKTGARIVLTEPLGYLDFIRLEASAVKIITDSGGVQKEAFYVQTPCITLRPETEWIETVDTHANILVRERTRQSILEAIYRPQSPRYQERPYGDGRASELIINTIWSKYYT